MQLTSALLERPLGLAIRNLETLRTLLAAPSPPFPFRMPVLQASLILLPLLGWLGRFRRKAASEPEYEKNNGVPILKEPSSPPSKLLFEQWVDDMESWPSRGSQASMSLIRQRPVLFVGIGSAGKTVLMFLADYLRAHWEEPWPHHIRLLHIGVSSEKSQVRKDMGFPSVVLHLDIEKRKRLSLEQVIQRLGKFDKTKLSTPGRALGTLAILADLAQGKVKSRLWSALDRAIGDLRDLSVYIVADAFSDEASGMIADVAHLVRQVARQQIGWMFLCLAVQHAQWRDDLSATRRGERVFATLRELQRLERTSARFTYAPYLGQPELDADSNVPLFDEIFLFDGLGEEQADEYRHDLSQLSAEDGLLPTLASCLIALLNNRTSSQFYQDAQNQLTLPMRRGKLPLETQAGAMGSFALRLPIEEMRRVIECRVVHKCLFDRMTGVVRWEELDAAGEPRHRGDVPSISVGPADVETFLQARGLPTSAIQNLSPRDLRRHLLAHLETQMNLQRDKQLLWPKQFLAVLREQLPSQGDQVADIEQSLQAWIGAVGESPESVPADPLTDFLGIAQKTKEEVKVVEGPLYRAWQAKWHQARELFIRADRMHGHRLLWKPDQEIEFFEKFFAYEKPWERIQRRMWWLWVEQADRANLRLVVLPAELDLSDPENRYHSIREAIRRNPLMHTYSAKDAKQIIAALLNLARQFSRGLKEQGFPFGEEKINALATEFQQKTSCLYRNHILGEARIAVEPFYYFTAPFGSLSQSLARAIQSQLTAHRPKYSSEDSTGTFHFHFMPSEYSTEYRLLQVQHVLPLNNMEAYVTAKEKYTTPRADLHVFGDEQVAVLWEEKGRQRVARDAPILAFSPCFVDLLARDEKKVRLFGLCVLYGLLKLDPKIPRIERSEDEHLEGLHGDIYQTVEGFLELLAQSPDLGKYLKKSIDRLRESNYSDKVAKLDKFREDVIFPLSRRYNQEAHDLALLLAATIWDEEKATD